MNKKIGIMQPYFFPYIAYWQLIGAVDEYVIYDDVNFIKGGWINRNRILSSANAQYFNVLLNGASPNKKINEIEIFNDNRQLRKLYANISNSYKKAPYYGEVYPFIELLLSKMTGNLSDFLCYTINEICAYFDINTTIRKSSMIEKNNLLSGEDKVIDICKRLSGDIYINAIGGQELYSASNFRDNGLKLCFLKSNNITYKQFENIFVPNLSIIDLMMFNSKETIKAYLKEFELIEGK